MYRMNPLRSMADYEGELLQNDLRKQGVQQNAQALEMGRMKSDEYTRSIQDANALRGVVSGFGADPSQNVMKLFGAGRLAEAQAYQKSIDESRKSGAGVAKDQAETLKTQLANGLQKFEIVGQVMSGVRDQASYDVARQQLAQAFGPEMAQNMPPNYDPNVIEQNRAKAMSVKEQMEQRLKDITFAETVRSNKAGEGLTARGQDITMRGQNLTDARARETTAATLTKPFEVTGPDGSPLLVQQDKQGNITPVQGYSPKTAADKPLNDAQSKSALFGARMEMANENMVNLEKSGTTTSIPGARMGMGIGPTISALQGPERQMLDQSKRDFINATLRRESGAVIADSEFANAEKQYFPQVGDSKEVIAQKRANREAAIRGVQIELPEKVRRKVIDEIKGQITPAKAGGGPKVGAVESGYRFKGGDPADPKNWEKQ